ncbi:cryptochrome/photolyase family protein [Shewanella submarina]|uniref:Cryptochrome/photolyase family protein n=1 Tax=Shewanella submarina TaxID=2016376 RepID=A0ABV7GBS7_9GAMM|nr:cryptochrome/photolyase family protein [Shewanella submarina]MCL1039554.1 cryptochrome/photolyase family protein [Shewanella submarina]
MKGLRLILGDQLNAAHSWYQHRDDNCLYLIAELHQETHYVRHHVQKVCGFFAAMAGFAGALKQAGHKVMHLTLDDTAQDRDLPALIKRICREQQVTHFEYQRPDEYRLQQQLGQLQSQLAEQGISSDCSDTEHFLLPFEQIESRFAKGKHVLMESFYRQMRRQTGILMTDGKPEGGGWNFDADNRHKLKPEDIGQIPEPLCFGNDVSAILQRLERHRVNTIGKAKTRLLWPVSRAQSRELLQYFIHHCLPLFGRFQDAMTAESPHSWSLYHSRLSFALNTKMLHPTEVIHQALAAWHSGDADIASVEGFVRQILGWREYVRGIYWRNMPDYADANHLQAGAALPEFFWNGDTRMQCMAAAIGQSLQTAYAHHIQRLMVTGNFSLLWGADPTQVDAWYLGIYMDAIEWVEMPNTRGMALFADGGLIATKPYAASGSYINRMSDYCSGCSFNVKARSSEDACPFNSLYWAFMVQHREKFNRNPRIGMIYRNWDRLDEGEQQATLARASAIKQGKVEL